MNPKPLDTSRPFTRSDALAAGISERAIRGSRFRRIFRNVYIDGGVTPTHWERTTAGLLLHPDGAWASHTSAAKMYGVTVPADSDVHISVLDARDRRWQPGLKPHVAPPHTTAVAVKGVRVSGPVRLFIELASVLSLVDLVVAGDSMLRVLTLSRAELTAGLEATREYWSSPARFAAAYLREEVDSPMETRLRMLLVLAGLPEPEVNFKIYDRNGHVVVRFDLSYPRLKLIIEYDGRQHATDVQQWLGDLARRELTDDLEWKMLKVTAEGVFQQPARTIARVSHAIRSRGGVVPQLSDAWRPWFPTRSAAA